MLVVSSFMALCQRENWALEIRWFRDHWLNCPFDKLFDIPDRKHLQIKEVSGKDRWIYDYPRKSNLWTAPLIHRFIFDKRIYPPGYDRIRKDPNALPILLNRLSGDFSVYIAACREIYQEDEMLNALHPTAAILNKIQNIIAAFSPDTIGIHIRRTDHRQAIAGSPTELYIEKMRKELAHNAAVNFYVASDSLAEKQRLRDLFKDKIITNEKEVRRDSPEGIQDALAEIYALSQTKKIYGSAYSSFAWVAAELSGTKKEWFY
jgi:hypothetical protein